MKREPNDPNEVKRTGHIYDGIEELDHAPPVWFMALFYLSIAFGIGYFVYYSMGEGPSLATEYERSKQADENLSYEQLAKTGGSKSLSDQDLKVLLKDPGKKKLGAVVYQAKCVSCHGAQGQGGIGPNLTDGYWIHGGKMSEVLTTISKGVLDKGMPPWGSVMSTDEVQAVTVFIRTLAGTTPAGAKAPQGLLVNGE